MNIKSLLLGSAAALVAVSGARAADAVVIAEPEPVEYVRVCDTYGAGFYYIPGTETCIQVGGYMQYDIGVGALGLEDVVDKEDLRDAIAYGDFDDVDTNDTYYKNARVSLQFDVRQETELGTLRGYAETRFNYGTTTDGVFFDPDATIVGDEFTGGISTQDNFINLEQGYIELGGFRVGKAATLFEIGTFAAGNVVNDDLINYGTFKTLQIAYTFTGANGFAASLALEEGGPGGDFSVDSDGDGIERCSRGRSLHARRLCSARRWLGVVHPGMGRRVGSRRLRRRLGRVGRQGSPGPERHRRPHLLRHGRLQVGRE